MGSPSARASACEPGRGLSPHAGFPNGWRASGLRNCRKTNVCLFSTPGLWHLVTAAGAAQVTRPMPATLSVPSSRQTPRGGCYHPLASHRRGNRLRKVKHLSSVKRLENGPPGREARRSPPPGPSERGPPPRCRSQDARPPPAPPLGSQGHLLFESPPQSYEEATVLSPCYSELRDLELEGHGSAAWLGGWVAAAVWRAPEPAQSPA